MASEDPKMRKWVAAGKRKVITLRILQKVKIIMRLQSGGSHSVALVS
jgi:hypothetical protein